MVVYLRWEWSTTQLNMLKASVWEKHSQELFPYKSSTFAFPFSLHFKSLDFGSWIL